MQPHNFFSTDATPSHSSRKNLILNSKKSPGSTQEVRNPKIGQQLGAQPTPRFRVMSEAMSEALIEAVIDPWPPFAFCHPSSFDPN